MTPDNNFSEFIHNGFECGLIYILRYLEEEACMLQFDTDDISHLASHLAEKKPWKTAPEWEEFINNHIST
jgi:hypothetical protein